MSQAIKRANAAYDHARTVDTVEAWREAATLLFNVQRKPRAPRGCRYPYPVAVATFADGTVTRNVFFSPAGKPLDWDRAQAVAAHAYRFERAIRRTSPMTAAEHRTVYPDLPLGYRPRDLMKHHDNLRRAVSVPPIVRLYDEATGEELPIQQSRQAA